MRERVPGWARRLVVGGWVGMAAAGVSALRYQPAWLEEQPRCRLGGECTAAEVEAGLGLHWWLLGLAGAVVLVGVVLLVWVRSSAAAAPTVRRLPVAGHAAAAGAAAAVLILVLLLPGLMALFLLGPHAAVAAGTGLWLAQARLVSALHRSYAARTSARETIVVGLTVSTAALGAAGRLSAQYWGIGPWWTAVLADGCVVALLVAFVRLLRDPLPERPGAVEVRGLAVAGVVVLAAGGLLTTVPVLRAPDAPAYVGTPSPMPPGRPTPAPTPDVVAPPPPPAAPAAGALSPCSHAHLEFAVVGFDAAMGARAASLQATNIGTASCWVEGIPIVVLLQGGRPLSLQVGPGQTPEGATAETQRVRISPGGRATALLAWRSYGGWADSETPQSLTTALDAGSTLVPAALADAAGPAPFDIADGGAWAISPWAPPST